MDSTAHDALSQRRRPLNSHFGAPPPPFVLIISAVLVLFFTFIAANFGDSPDSVSAQTTPSVTLVDYDIDDDGFMDIRTNVQFSNIQNDMDTDGTPDAARDAVETAAWNAAWPNPMPGMGCADGDHDSDPMTPEQPTCIGYELMNDIVFAATGNTLPTMGWDGDVWGFGTRPGLSGTLKGNGYRVVNARHDAGNGVRGMFHKIESNGKVEGLGLWNPLYRNGNDHNGTVAAEIKGVAEGVFVYGNGEAAPNYLMESNIGGGITALLTGGRIVNSFVYTTEHVAKRSSGNNTGGLIGRVSQGGSCRNSYFSGRLYTGGGGRTGGLLVGQSGATRANMMNCVGDISVEGFWAAWNGADAGENRDFRATRADMQGATGYDMPPMNPFSSWDTDANGDAQDMWNFGTDMELPVLKGYGHDRTFPRERTLWHATNHSMNLCTRTPAVANEIIRHLKDGVWRPTTPPIEEVPEVLANLTPCSSIADTRTVTLGHMRDFVYTTEDNPFRLNPDRTTPASPRLTVLQPDDFAYMWNARHFDLSGNALTTLPHHLFQDSRIWQLDLSGNALTCLHPDLFTHTRKPSTEEQSANFMFVNLDGNRLTTSGLPDRVFDDLSHVNGLSLSSNALDEINTRWFERLGSLGVRPMGDTKLRPEAGLQLAGNAISAHYYWHRGFDDFRLNQVEFSGAQASASLLAALRARMVAAGTNIMNLDLESTQYLANGQLGSGNCPSDLTSGPPGTLDINGMPVQCQIAASWAPPWQESAPPRVRSATATGTAASITISFSYPEVAPGTLYQVRYRKRTNNLAAAWEQPWRVIPLDLSATGTKSFTIDGLERDITYRFQLRAVVNGAVGEISELTQGTTAALPAVNKIQPTIREISVQAGQKIRLSVEVYGRQDDLNNDLADDDATVVFRWTEPSGGGGTFASPSSDRRVTYTAPSLPGTYTVTAEAQPDGICVGHHNSRTITDDDRAPCIATFTIRVSRAPGVAEPPADPINPAGLIPSSLTDSDGVAYAVFTPVGGGTFTGEGITVSAIKGAVPDGQLLGVSATASAIPVPAPIPGARMTLAGSYFEVNGVQRNGEAPVSGYALDDPISACLPVPDMFRSDISDVVVVNRNPSDGTLGILSSKVRQTDGGLVVCGSIGKLPATVAAARIGIVEATPEPPQEPGIDDLSVGAVTPGPNAAVWAMVIGTMMLAAVAATAGITGIRRRTSRR